MIQVSIVIITKNEAKNIDACVSRCKMISDNIIVVDNDSTDDTIKIARELGCHVYQENWKGYGANKNKGAEYAKYDWILSIDADEIPDFKLISTLNGLNLSDPTFVYDIKFKSYFGNKLIRFGNWGNDHRIRLFNRKITKWSEVEVHEKLQLPKNTRVIRISGCIHHYTVKNFKECDYKAIYYAKLSAKQLIESKKKIHFLKFYISPIYGFIRNYIIRLGFLDGNEGFIIATTIYRNTWVKYYYLKKESMNANQLKKLDMEF
jgi:glycosyltransferase involved in cell wall biosynthesis